MALKKDVLLLLGLLTSVLFANSSGSAASGFTDAEYADPLTRTCGTSGFESFVCNIMKSLLTIGPMLAIIGLLVAGMIYIYASVFVTADQRGRYHTLATNLAIGSVILAALVGGAGFIAKAGKGFLVTS